MASSDLSPTRFVTLAALAWIVVVAIVWSSGGHLLTNDGPAQLFSGFVEAELHNPALRFADYYQLNIPPSSRGFRDLFLVFYRWLKTWETAYLISVTCCLTLWIVGALFLAVTISGRRSITHILLVFLSLQTSYYFGFYPFILGMGFCFIGLGLWLTFAERPALATLLAMLCFFLGARCHVVAAGIVGVLVAADALSRGKRATLCGALVGLPVVWVLFELRQRIAGSPADVFYGPLIERILRFPDGFIPGPAWKTWPAFVVVIVGFVQACRARPRHKAIMLTAFALVLVALAVPRDFLGWQYASWRFLPIACVVGVAFLEVPRTWIGRTLVAGVGASQLVWAGWFHLDQRAEYAPFFAAIEKIGPKPAFRFPIIRAPAQQTIYQMSPDLHLGQLVAMRTGGATYYGHDHHPGQHSILIFDGPLLPTAADVTARRVPGRPGDVAMAAALTRAARFDGVIYYGFADEADYLRKTGYQIVFQDGPLIVADLVGCPLEIVVENATSAVTVAVGFEGTGEPVHEFSLVPGATSTHSHVIERFPCGRRWLTVKGEQQRCDKGRVVGTGPSLRCVLAAAPPEPRPVP